MSGLAFLSRAALAAVAAFLTSELAAFERVQAPPAAKPEMMEVCPGLVAARRPRVVPAAFRLAALKAGQVRITYAGHSTFLIESPKLCASRPTTTTTSGRRCCPTSSP